MKEDVTIVGPLNLPATMPDHASSLYARNVQSLLELMVEGGRADARLRGRGDRRRLHHARRRDRARGRAQRGGGVGLHGPAHRADHPGARRVRRLRGDLEGAEHAAHAADVGHQRHPRHRAARRPLPDRRRPRASSTTSCASSRSPSGRSTWSVASSSPTACCTCSGGATDVHRELPSGPGLHPVALHRRVRAVHRRPAADEPPAHCPQGQRHRRDRHGHRGSGHPADRVRGRLRPDRARRSRSARSWACPRRAP